MNVSNTHLWVVWTACRSTQNSEGTRGSAVSFEREETTGVEDSYCGERVWSGVLG